MPLSKATHLLLFTLILFMQSATLVHSVEHDVYEHTELCSVYLSAEKISAIDTSAPFYLAPFYYSEFVTERHAPSLSGQSYSPYAPRAPPLF